MVHGASWTVYVLSYRHEPTLSYELVIENTRTSAASAAASLRLPLQLAQGDEGPRTVTPSEHPEDIGIATQATAPGLDDGDI